MKRSHVAALVLAVVLSASCASSEGTGDGTSGIRGTAHIGPQCPVEVAGSPCPDAPFEGTIQVITTGGRKVARVETAADGSFEVPLEPGSYVIDVVSDAGGLPFVKPVTFEVRAGSYTDVDVAVDSGIR